MRIASSSPPLEKHSKASLADPEDTYKSSIKKVARVARADTLTPAERYQELFIAVQTQRIFSDSKYFTDCAPKEKSPPQILALYRSEKNAADFDLQTFVQTHFSLPENPAAGYVSPSGVSLRAHIDGLWPVLTRKPQQHPGYSSILPLPNSYVMPGGRFTELYYWDSYFAMLGLAASGRIRLLRDMAHNFAYLIDTYGLIPNGNRNYYLSRSQPPVFALMVELFESVGVDPALKFLPQLRKEYAYWMDESEQLRPGDVHRHVVRMPGGELLNRYWDDRDSPREESFIEDIMTARNGSRPVHDVYRDLRAAATSGWDFSSRWLDQDGGLETIRTSAILPVDLNSFLFKLESKIAELSGLAGDTTLQDAFQKKADMRKTAMSRFMWNEEEGAFFDYDWQRGHMRSNLTAACATPLYVGAASQSQAHHVAATISRRLLKNGGVATTEIVSGEQWDRPNGWAPLQWIAILGLENYGHNALAEDIARRWLLTVNGYYERYRKVVEKYALSDVNVEAEGGGGGEYPLQDGFGWTNGVTRALMTRYPSSVA